MLTGESGKVLVKDVVSGSQDRKKMEANKATMQVFFMITVFQFSRDLLLLFSKFHTTVWLAGIEKWLSPALIPDRKKP